MTERPQTSSPPDVDPSDPPDSQIKPEIRTGDTHADLWRQHVSTLTQFATLLVGPHDAHDIVSIAFHRVTRRLDTGFEPDNVRAYLMRAITNAATDQHRSRRRQQARDLRAAAGSPTGTPEPALPDFDLRHAVAGLSVQQRAVVYFTYWEDLDSRQVSRLLEIEPATVRRHLARARQQLRQQLGQQLGRELS